MDKTCNKCHLTKDVNEFHKATDNHDGLQHFCKICKKAIDRARYLSTDKKSVCRKRAVNMQSIITEIKRAAGCKYCTEKDPVALDFHHTNKDKEFNIGRGGKSMSLDKLLKEIQKCEVICANCHRKLHAGTLKL